MAEMQFPLILDDKSFIENVAKKEVVDEEETGKFICDC